MDGFERTLGTNYLGPFALTGLTLPALLRSSDPRVITVASAAARQGKIDLDDLESQKRYGLNAAYARSKLADLIFALELQRRVESNGVRLMSVACHPGYAITNLQNSELTLGIRLVPAVLKPWAAHGALPTLFAATSARAKSGAYYGPDGILEAKGYPAPVQIPQKATDHSLAKGLWEVSEKLTGVQYDALTGLR